MPDVRSRLKTTAELVLAHGGPALVARSLRRHQAVVLSYHNILPDECGRPGDASLHLPRATFAAQLDALAETHEIVPLDGLLDDPLPRHSRPRAAITFDDAYRGALTVGIDELVRRGIPATMFVAPGELGARAFWWDLLADPALGEVTPDVRRLALEDYAGEGSRILPRLAPLGSAGGEPLPPDAMSATEEELRHAVNCHSGLTLASHGWSHPNLARLDADRLASELAQPLTWLRDRFSAVVPWISYPYGLSSQRVHVAAARAGYRGGVTQSVGWISAPTGDPFLVPRLNVPAGLSLDGFIARVAGVL